MSDILKWLCSLFKAKAKSLVSSEMSRDYERERSESANRIKELESALLFMVRNEEVHKKIAEMQGEPYVNKGLDYAKSLLAGEKKE